MNPLSSPIPREDQGGNRSLRAHPKAGWVGIPLGIGAVAVATAAGDQLTRLGARHTGELALDAWISEHRDSALTLLARGIDTGLGGVHGQLLVIVLSILVAVRSRVAGLSLFAVSFVGYYAAGFVKLFVARPRPFAGSVHPLVVALGRDSFPSGHTALAASLVAGILVALRLLSVATWPAWILGSVFVAVVAWSRLYLGAHYLGDVIGSVVVVAGAVIAFLSFVLVAHRALNRVQQWVLGPVLGGLAEDSRDQAKLSSAVRGVEAERTADARDDRHAEGTCPVPGCDDVCGCIGHEQGGARGTQRGGQLVATSERQSCRDEGDGLGAVEHDPGPSPAGVMVVAAEGDRDDPGDQSQTCGDVAARPARMSDVTSHGRLPPTRGKV